jgi:hypothetical protein
MPGSLGFQQDPLTSGWKAKQEASVRGVGTIRVVSSPDGSHSPARSPRPHQIDGRWKSSSADEPTGEPKAHATRLKNRRTGIAIAILIRLADDRPRASGLAEVSIVTVAS